MKFTTIEAKCLTVGDRFVPKGSLSDAMQNQWLWTVVRHDFTQRGDYSTIVESDETTWTERYGPDEIVWLAEP